MALATDTRTFTGFSTAALSYGDFEGWCMCVGLSRSALIVILTTYFLSLSPCFRHFHYSKTAGIRIVTREQCIINCANSSNSPPATLTR